MNREQLEFLISQYLDGSLPSEQRLALEARLAEDAGARKLLAEYQAIDAAMESAIPVPTVQWDRLGDAITSAVAGQVMPGAGESGASDDALEFTITQYLDGDLPETERSELEKRLAVDPAAQRLLAQYRSLDVMLKHAWPMPHVEWDRFAGHLFDSVAEEQAPSVYAISSWVRYGTRMAIAACVLIVAGLAVRFGLNRGGPATPVGPVAQTQVLEVHAGAPEVASGKAVVQISIGPADDLARARYSADSSGIVATPMRVEVAGNLHPWNDVGGLPF